MRKRERANYSFVEFQIKLEIFIFLNWKELVVLRQSYSFDTKEKTNCSFMEFQIKLDIFILQIEKNYWSSLFINYSFRGKADCSFIKFQLELEIFIP